MVRTLVCGLTHLITQLAYDRWIDCVFNYVKCHVSRLALTSLVDDGV